MEKFGGCPLCTSWGHQKSSCKATPKCRNLINNNICGGQHSSYICGSGNAYCGSLKYTLLSSSTSEGLVSSSSPSIGSAEKEFSSKAPVPDLNAQTLLLFQDVEVIGADLPAFLCFDGGSTRCLITHKYAKACSMKGESVVYRLDVVGNKGKPEEGCYYMFELVQSDGSLKFVWAYGIERIMEDPEPVDLSPVRKLFPHLPSEVFAAPAPRREVDILIGNNFLSLHPSGGQGRDAVGELRAYESLFGQGWVLAGSHTDIKPGRNQLTISTLNMANIKWCEMFPELQPSFLDLMKPSILLILTIMMFYMLLNQGMVFLMIFLLVEQVLTTLFSFKQVSSLFSHRKVSTLQNMFSDKLSVADEEYSGKFNSLAGNDEAGQHDHGVLGGGEPCHGHAVAGHASDAAPDDGVV